MNRPLVVLLCLFVFSQLAVSQNPVVTTVEDTVDAADGVTSLREAVASANAGSVASTITFSPTVFHPDSNRTIRLKQGIVLTRSSISIDGANARLTLGRDTTVADSIRFDAVTLKGGNSGVARIRVTGMKGSGIVIDSAAGTSSTIGPSNEVTNCEDVGIKVLFSTGHVIKENRLSNNGLDGIFISGAASGVVAQDNYCIKNTGSGIGALNSSGLTIKGNRLLGNSANGLMISGGNGSHSIEQNIAMGNSYDGILIEGASSGATLIRLNSVGDSLSGAFPGSGGLARGTVEISPLLARSPLYNQFPSTISERVRVNGAKINRIRPPRVHNPNPHERRSEPRRPSVAKGSSRSAVNHTGNGWNGIALYGVSAVTVEDNLIFGSGDDGIYLSTHAVNETTSVSSSDIVIRKNRFEFNYDSQIEFYGVVNLSVTNNAMRSSGYGVYGGGTGGYYGESRDELPVPQMGAYGATSLLTPSVTIHENGFSLGDEEAIYLWGLDEASIERNIINNYYDGIELSGVRIARVRSNELTAIDYGTFYVSSVDSGWVTDNVVRGGYEGIYIYGRVDTLSYLEALRNTIHAVEYDAFGAYTFATAIIRDNRIDGTYYEGMDLGNIGTAWVERNTVLDNYYEGFYLYNIKTLHFLDNTARGQYDDEGVYLSSIERAYLHRNVVTDGYRGISCRYIDSLWMSGNTVTSSRSDGFELYSAKLVHMWENDFYGHHGDGVSINSVDSLLIERNNLSTNIYYGLYLSSNKRTTVRHNTILENNDYGLYSSSDSLLVVEQNFFALNGYGFYVYFSDTTSRINNNTFYRNKDGSYYTGVTQAFNAKNNYWGDPSGPYDDQNTDGLNQTNPGKGDHVSESIVYLPFLTTPPYLSEARPVVSSISPSESPRAGGVLAGLRGRQLLPGVQVFFGKDTIKNVKYVSSDLLSFTLPPGRGGPVNIIVKNLNGKADTLVRGFKYENAAPFGFALSVPSENSMAVPRNPIFRWRRALDPDGDQVEYILLYSRFETFEDSLTVERITDTTYIFRDTLVSNTRYYWRIVATDTRDEYVTSPTFTFTTGAIVGIAETQQIPQVFRLEQNYPNPFNPTTTIRFEIPAHAHTVVRLYDIVGREVLTLVNDEKAPGFYSIVWDGKNHMGQPVASGVYFLTFRAGTHSDVKRLVLVR